MFATVYYLDVINIGSYRLRPMQYGGRQTGKALLVSASVAVDENRHLAVGVAFLSVLQRQILLLPVWFPPSCVYDVD